MSEIPKLATEDQLKSVADTFTELYNHQGKQIKSIESGIIDTIVPASPAPTKRGQYVVSEIGVYLNFKDSNNQPISIKEEEFTSGIVYLIFNGTDCRKVVVTIEANGEVKEGNTGFVNGGNVYKKTILPSEIGIIGKITKGDNIAPILLNNHYDDSYLWEKGYLDQTGNIVLNEKWYTTKQSYPIESGNYTLYLYLTPNTNLVFYDNEGNIQKIINNTKADVPYNFNLEFNGFVKFCMIVGNMNFKPSLITQQDFENTTITSDVFSKRDYVDLKIQEITNTLGLKSSSINFIENTSFNLFDKGYLNSKDLIEDVDNWLTSFFIPISKGHYLSNLYLTENAYMHLYDSNLTLYDSFNNHGQGANMEMWEFEVVNNGYIRYCFPLYTASNSLYITPKNNDYNSDLFVSKSELQTTLTSIIRPQHDFCKGIQNSLGTESFWKKGFYNENGEISIENGWINAKIRVESGVVFINGYFIGSAKYVVFNKRGDILQVLSGTHRNGDQYGHVYFNTKLHEDAYEIGLSYRLGQFGIKNIHNLRLILKSNIFTKPSRISEIDLLNTIDYVDSIGIGKAIFEKERDVVYSSKRMPIISFVSDDLHIENDVWYIPLLEKNHIKGTFAYITGWFDNPDFYSKEQVQELYKRGHDIASHSVNHAKNLIKQPIDVIEKELLTSKLMLQELGINPDGYISPYGEFSPELDKIVRKYYNWNMMTNMSLFSNIPPINRLRLSRASFDGIQHEGRPKLDVLKERIDETLESEGWLIIATHPQYGEYKNKARESEMQELIDYIRSKEINILSVNQAYSYYKNKIQIGDFSIDPIKIIGMDEY